MKNGLFYIDVHSSNFPAGEIRGQFGLTPSISGIQFNATSYFVGERTGSVTVSVSRSGDTSSPVTINYATSNGTANIHNLSPDQRTRVRLFATGIELSCSEGLSSILVQLEDSQNRIYPLVVEDIQKVPNFDFSQIVVKLPDAID